MLPIDMHHTPPACPMYLRAQALPGALSMFQSLMTPSTPADMTNSFSAAMHRMGQSCAMLSPFFFLGCPNMREGAGGFLNSRTRSWVKVRKRGTRYMRSLPSEPPVKR